MIASLLLAVSILEHTSTRIVTKIDPMSVHPVPLVQKQIDRSKEVVAFSANYSSFGLPIGAYSFEGRTQATISLPSGLVRPVFSFSRQIYKMSYSNDLSSPWMKVPAMYDMTLQAGPLLIVPSVSRDGTLKGDLFIGVNAGKFLDDAVRKTSHAGIGVTKNGILVVAWDASITLSDLAVVLQRNGAVWAMSTDGGHAAYFEVSPLLYKTLSSDGLPIKYGTVLCGVALEIQ